MESTNDFVSRELFHQSILSNHLADCFGGTFNSVTPLSDQERISPHNTNTISIPIQYQEG